MTFIRNFQNPPKMTSIEIEIHSNRHLIKIEISNIFHLGPVSPLSPMKSTTKIPYNIIKNYIFKFIHNLLVLFDILPRIFYQAHKKLEQTKTLFLHFD